MEIIAKNRRAYFDYEILEKYVAGLVLKGCEVKSIKTGHISLSAAFITAHQGELFLTNANIPPYAHAGQIPDYNPTASRKLLARKKEIKYLLGKVKVQGLTIVPLFVYTKGRMVKLSFALAKGKKKFDKREKIRQREDKRNMDRLMKNN